MSVNQDRLDPAAVFYVTLSYPDTFADDPEVWRRHRGRLADRLRYHWGWPVVWKLEFQERGAAHYHMIVFGTEAAALADFREWLPRAWYEIVGSGNENHLAHGTYVAPMKSWEAIAWYTCKHLGAEVPTRVDEETGEVLPVGRFWGVWGDLPIDRNTETLTDKGFFWMRRCIQRYKQRKPRSRRAGLSGIVPQKMTERLIAEAKSM